MTRLRADLRNSWAYGHGCGCHWARLPQVVMYTGSTGCRAVVYGVPCRVSTRHARHTEEGGCIYGGAIIDPLWPLLPLLAPPLNAPCSGRHLAPHPVINASAGTVPRTLSLMRQPAPYPHPVVNALAGYPHPLCLTAITAKRVNNGQ